MDSSRHIGPRLFRARNLYRGFGVPSDRFDYLRRLFLSAFPTFLLSLFPLMLSFSLTFSLSVYLPFCPFSARTHTCPVCGRLPAFPVLALYHRPPATRIARLNVRASLSFLPGDERGLSLVPVIYLPCPDGRAPAIVRQIYFTLLLAVYGNKFPRRFDYPR